MKHKLTIYDADRDMPTLINKINEEIGDSIIFLKQISIGVKTVEYFIHEKEDCNYDVTAMLIRIMDSEGIAYSISPVFNNTEDVENINHINYLGMMIDYIDEMNITTNSKDWIRGKLKKYYIDKKAFVYNPVECLNCLYTYAGSTSLYTMPKLVRKDFVAFCDSFLKEIDVKSCIDNSMLLKEYFVDLLLELHYPPAEIENTSITIRNCIIAEIEEMCTRNIYFHIENEEHARNVFNELMETLLTHYSENASTADDDLNIIIDYIRKYLKERF